MAENSKIEWCDHTFNGWLGCTKVSPGCAHCYAETLMDTRYGRVKWGKGQPRLRTSEATWNLPLRWEGIASRGHFRYCPECGWSGAVNGDDGMDCPTPNCSAAALDMETVRPRVFCSSLSDWLDDQVPFEWLADLLSLIHVTENLDWLLLTKRPQLWRARIELAKSELERRRNEIVSATAERYFLSAAVYRLEQWLGGNPPKNIWIGTTVEDQTRADERIHALLDIPANIRFLSCEPLLTAVDLTRIRPINRNAPCTTNALTGETFWPDNDRDEGPSINWVIVGGESGKGARPMHPAWVRSLRDQCASEGVPFFFKQWGEWEPTLADNFDWRAKRMFLELDGTDSTDWTTNLHSESTANMQKVGKKKAGRILCGREHNGFPQ